MHAARDARQLHWLWCRVPGWHELREFDRRLRLTLTWTTLATDAANQGRRREPVAMTCRNQIMATRETGDCTVCAQEAKPRQGSRH
jgi:hypothetical protein